MDSLTDDRGRLLYLEDIADITGMPINTIRSQFHRGILPLWKLGRRLVIWERDLTEWLDEHQQATLKDR